MKRSNNRHCFLLLMVLLMLTGALPLPLSAQDQPGEAMARLYIEEAFQYYEKGLLNESTVYMTKAEGFSRNFSDIWFYKAFLSYRFGDGSSLHEIRENFEKALSLHQWIAFSPLDTRIPLAKIYLSLGEYEKILRQRREISNTLVNDPEWFLCYLKALVSLGKREEADKALKEALRIFPDSIDWYLPHYKGGWLSDERIEDWIYLARQGKSQDQEALQRALLQFRGQESASVLMQIYEAAFGSDTFYKLFQYLYVGREEIPALDLSGLRQWILMRDFYSRPENRGAAGEFDGLFWGDLNYDGFIDVKVTYGGGQLLRLSLDRDQDRISEWTIVFDPSGGIDSLWYYDHSVLAQIHYGEYPLAEWIEIHRGESLVRRYTLVPRDSRLEIIPFHESDPARGWDSEAIFPGIWNISQDFPLSLSELTQRSLRVEESENQQLRHRWEIKAGEIAAFYSDTRNQGVLDKVLYIRGNQVIGGRRDLDLDGRYEVMDIYQGGRWVGSTLDQDGNKQPEYFESNQVGKIRAWDINQDNTIDSLYLGGLSPDEWSYRDIQLTPEDVYDWEFAEIENY